MYLKDAAGMANSVDPNQTAYEQSVMGLHYLFDIYFSISRILRFLTHTLKLDKTAYFTYLCTGKVFLAKGLEKQRLFFTHFCISSNSCIRGQS